MIRLGLDIGTNSVGSAWADYETGEIRCGVSIFPAGVDETDEGRGEPKGQNRRLKRHLRRLLRRRAARKRKLIEVLVTHGLLPTDAGEREKLFSEGVVTPWHLRRKGLREELTPYEFGRVLVHLNQRRGAFGVHVKKHEDDEAAKQASDELKGKKKKGDRTEEGEIKAAIEQTNSWLSGRTFGEAIADELEGNVCPIGRNAHREFVATPVRNRRDSYRYIATRETIRSEFLRLWEKQASFNGELAPLLTRELKKLLDDPEPADPKVASTWRHGGIIFGQRRHYWDIGSLGRCDLEPTERCCPLADRHAQYFRVIETVNNLRLQVRGSGERSLSESERAMVIGRLRRQKTGSVAAIREALGIDKRTLKKQGGRNAEMYYRLNIEADGQREINTDWFYREVVVGAIGEDDWNQFDERRREAINLALLRFDPETPGDDQKLGTLAAKWWGLGEQQIAQLTDAWRKRPKTDRRLRLSRTAIRKLTRYMEEAGTDRSGNPLWLTVTNARQAFAEDPTNGAMPEERVRYAFTVTSRLRELLLRDCGGDEEAVRRLLSLRGLSADDRHYLKKHPGQLPPPPMLANPVARKAVFAVRAHINAYLKKYGRKPDQIVIEMTRDATKPRKLRDQELTLIRTRQKVRRQIIRDHQLENLSPTQQAKAIERVLLAMQQHQKSAYSGDTLNFDTAARGKDSNGRPVEVDHIVPRACGGGDGINNLVLCYAEENRGKGKQCPKAWLGERFDVVEQIFEPIIAKDLWKTRTAGGYFTWRDSKAKWDNLHKELREVSAGWMPSQLNDTAVAAREVAAYLQSALYPDELFDEKELLREGQASKRRIFFTKGIYTSRLRHDWQLYQKVGHDDGETPGKDRRDHRHHAVDAAVIALTDNRVLPLMARLEREYEERCLEAKERGERIEDVPRPTVPVPAPWCEPGRLRQIVMGQLYQGGIEWAVSHKPIKRRLADAFHEDTAYGPTRDAAGKDGVTSDELFTKRKDIAELKPDHLRLPRQENDDEVRKRLTAEYKQQGLGRRAKAEAEKAFAEDRFTRKLVDPSPGKGGIVRDRALREQLRRCLQANGADPDDFSKSEVATLVRSGKFRFDSGVPIHGFVLLCVNNSPVRIAGRVWDPVKREMVASGDPLRDRVYVGGNNHHIEIRENDKGKWEGEVVSTYVAACRNRDFLKARAKAERAIRASAVGDVREKLRRARREARLAHPVVDRGDNENGRFVMSLCEGEMVLMRHWETGEPGVFVVCKIDATRVVHFALHTDGRRATGEKEDKEVLPGSVRESQGIRIGRLREMGVDGRPPVKVRVSPLGEIEIVDRD